MLVFSAPPLTKFLFVFWKQGFFCKRKTSITALKISQKMYLSSVCFLIENSPVCYKVKQSPQLKMIHWIYKNPQRIKYSLHWSIVFQSVGEVITITRLPKDSNLHCVVLDVSDHGRLQLSHSGPGCQRGFMWASVYQMLNVAFILKLNFLLNFFTFSLCVWDARVYILNELINWRDVT